MTLALYFLFGVLFGFGAYDMAMWHRDRRRARARRFRNIPVLRSRPILRVHVSSPRVIDTDGRWL